MDEITVEMSVRLPSVGGTGRRIALAARPSALSTADVEDTPDPIFWDRVPRADVSDAPVELGQGRWQGGTKASDTAPIGLTTEERAVAHNLIPADQPRVEYIIGGVTLTGYSALFFVEREIDIMRVEWHKRIPS